MLIVFWICAFVIFYVYLGYPLLLASGALGTRRLSRRQCVQPSLSILIPARNEGKVIGTKLRNLLTQNYPLEKLEILVGNDGSSDATAALASEFLPSGIQLVSSDESRGKSSTQNGLVERAQGEILVFTDADCMLPANALRTMMQHFTDPQVGLVTSCVRFQNQSETAIVENESLYWKYERWLRNQESDRGLLAMASGSLFAMRRTLWQPLDPNVGDDFVLPLSVAKAGFRNVLETRFSPTTILTQNQPGSMFRMKMRIISKDLRGLLRNASCLNPFHVGRVALSLWSHKLLRWAVPYFLIVLFLSNLLLTAHMLYAITLATQITFYSVSVLGLLLRADRIRRPLSPASSFCLVNLAALFGTLHCFTLQTAGRWKPVR